MNELTPKQEEVLRLMARGLTNGQIAERLGVTLAGAKWHVSEVLSRLGVSSREEAVALWKARSGATSRLSSLAGALLGTKAVIAGAAVAAVAGVFVAGTLALSGGKGDEEQDQMANASTVDVLRPDGQGRFVYPGNCASWTVTDDGVPLCAPMAGDEVRFVIDFVGARVTIRGIAGEQILETNVVLSDGSRVLAGLGNGFVGPGAGDADGGGRFLHDGVYVTPPARLELLDKEGGLLRTVDLMSASASLDWPPVTPDRNEQPGVHEQVVDGACVNWRFGNEAYIQCLERDRLIGGRTETTVGGRRFLGGVEPEDLTAVIAGFEDGSLQTGIVEGGLTPDGRAFIAWSIAGSDEDEVITLTFVRGAESVVENQQLEPASRPSNWDIVGFSDGNVGNATDSNGCLVISRLENSMSGLGVCAGARELRYVAEHPILSAGFFVVAAGWVQAFAVVNPAVDVVEVVDADGNLYRERAQVIPSSPQGLKFVYFDREVAAPARDVRALDAAGNVLETQEGAFGSHASTATGR